MKTAENTSNILYGLVENVNDQIDKESNISTEERGLDNAENNNAENDEEHLINAFMDDADEAGGPLSQSDFEDDYSGGDLDVPRYSDGYDEDDDQLGEDDDNEEDDDE